MSLEDMTCSTKAPFLPLKKPIALYIIALLVLLELFFEGYGAPVLSRENTSQGAAVKNAADRSAAYLMRQVKKNGMFNYRINMDATVKVKKKYNILRHAGTIYAMAMYHQLYPDAQLKSAMERAAGYLRDKPIQSLPGRDDILAVWSYPEVNRSNTPLQAKLGAAGLTLLALLSVEKIHPEFTPIADLRALGRFIVYMQKKDGAFYSKYIPSKGGRRDQWESLYYPGEAALGLLMLYEKDPSAIWIETASKALRHLAIHRRNKPDIPADHWALLATEKLLSFDHTVSLPVSRDLLLNHALGICKTILQGQMHNPEQPLYYGGFSKDGRTTPTSIRLEGLLAALSFLPPGHGTHKRITAAIPNAINFLLRAQIDEGRFRGAFPRAIDKIPVILPDAYHFNRRATEVRIDYVQHALSALLQYLQILDLQHGKHEISRSIFFKPTYQNTTKWNSTNGYYLSIKSEKRRD